MSDFTNTSLTKPEKTNDNDNSSDLLVNENDDNTPTDVINNTINEDHFTIPITNEIDPLDDLFVFDGVNDDLLNDDTIVNKPFYIDPSEDEAAFAKSLNYTYGNKRKNATIRKLNCPIIWSDDNKPRINTVIEIRLMNAEYICGVFLDLFNIGYPEALNTVVEDNVEYKADFLSQQHPLLKPGEKCKPVHYFGVKNLVEMYRVLSTTIPDHYFTINEVKVFKEGMHIVLKTKASGTPVSYAKFGNNELYKATEVRSENEVSTSKMINMEHEMNITLNRFNKISKIYVQFWVLGEKDESKYIDPYKYILMS
eukprot:TRINITY_DN114460_c0_g1_i1.p1 TRINITY_DN114460_c0_g1~~TRINITY_DN114460_c0_g1_i1.p1  ORF type:complete len:310 (+),score=-7.49 TRINITY_DN114460_c0_g1_i1:14-943(+)